MAEVVKLLGVEEGDEVCQHCNKRRISTIFAVEVDGVLMRVGSTCVGLLREEKVTKAGLIKELRDAPKNAALEKEYQDMVKLWIECGKREIEFSDVSKLPIYQMHKPNHKKMLFKRKTAHGIVEMVVYEWKRLPDGTEETFKL